MYVVAFCNNANYSKFDLVFGSSGGLSSCASVDSNSNCSGGYGAPSWQSRFGYATRSIPDVSMLATSWVTCSENQPCAATGTVYIGSGTSAAAPAMASIILLMDQSRISPSNPDGRQGNINPLIYAMGEYQQTALSQTPGAQCSADAGAAISSFCIFHDVQTGAMTSRAARRLSTQEAVCRRPNAAPEVRCIPS
jgi:subtilase family serine protease